MICTFLGAGVGQYIRKSLRHREITLLLSIVISVVISCLTYAGVITLAEIVFNISTIHETGYVCAMLFVIPGFPFITSGIDLAKLDMRSGLERLVYSVMIILVSTVVAWIVALTIKFEPGEFNRVQINPYILLILRVIASFVGVYGFSIMFNSPKKMAATAGVIGAIANVLRLELIDFTNIPVAAATFIGAFSSGILASLIIKKAEYPRITLTVPSIVIMVPGLYLYNAIYNIGNMNIEAGTILLTKAIFIIIALPLGLIFSRMLFEKRFRHSI